MVWIPIFLVNFVDPFVHVRNPTMISKYFHKTVVITILKKGFAWVGSIENYTIPEIHPAGSEFWKIERKKKTPQRRTSIFISRLYQHGGYYVNDVIRLYVDGEAIIFNSESNLHSQLKMYLRPIPGILLSKYALMLLVFLRASKWKSICPCVLLVLTVC